MEAHPAVQPLAYLVGKWRGQGEGDFPTISSFSYGEELTFSFVPGKPVIAYTQKTWKLDSREPMHAESGYWRPKLDGTALASSKSRSNCFRSYPSLHVSSSKSITHSWSFQKGTYDAQDKSIKLQSQVVGNASKVKEINRIFELVHGDLSYVVQMATHRTPLQPHLKAVLKKL